MDKKKWDPFTEILLICKEKGNDEISGSGWTGKNSLSQVTWAQKNKWCVISPICRSSFSSLALFGVPIEAEELGKGHALGCMKGAEVEEHRKGR